MYDVRFLLEEADKWREEVWDIIKQRSDVKFYLLTKRPERVHKCLPSDWGNGWENVFLMLPPKIKNVPMNVFRYYLIYRLNTKE